MRDLYNQKSLIEDFVLYCQSLEDKRQPVKKSHQIEEVLFLCLSASFAGCEGYTSIKFFGDTHIKFLKRYLSYKEGIPSESTIFRVLSMINPDLFETFFSGWFADFCTTLPQGEVIALDGKTIRGSKRGGKDPLHILHACASDSGIILSFKEVDSKTNEITVIPDLLDSLNIEGNTFTMDAMGCQRDICQKIGDEGGDYIIGLKGNQGTLHEDVDLLFSEKQFLDVDNTDVNTEYDKGHGRIEERVLTATKDIGYLIEQHNWPYLKSVIMCEYRRLDKTKNNKKKEVLYYITSHEPNALLLQKMVRKHWSVESMHWVLDMIFDDDKIAISIDNAAENLAFIRRVAFNVMKLHKKFNNLKQSMNILQKTCLARPKLIGEMITKCHTYT